MRKTNHLLIASVTALSIVFLSGCTASPKHNSESREAKPPSSQPSDLDDLQAAMDKLQAAIEKPASAFHVSFKKSESDGRSYTCEVDISPDGITGQQTDVSPTTHIGNDVFPAATRVRQLNGTPHGSPAWSVVYGGIAMAYLNGHIRDAQQAVKYTGDEQTGGYDARHYDFDLTGIDADIKKAMALGNAFGGARQTKDYNVKGSAWVAKDDGRMVKFSFDNIYTFSDGTTDSTRFEGVVTKK